MDSTEAYTILEIEESASIEQIKQAYRKLALRFHPDRIENKHENGQFLQIKEAYQLLMFVKEISFETKEITIELLPPNEFELKLTLEELFNGCIKNQTITRKSVNKNGVETCEDKEFTVKIKPGSLARTRIIFGKEGDFQYGKVQANVVFTITEMSHQIFRRHRFDLYYTAKVETENLILGCKIKIPTLDKEEIIVEIDENILFNNVRKIPNKGFPYLDCQNKRGDLIVLFEIIFENEIIETENYQEYSSDEEFGFNEIFGSIDLFSDSE